MQISKIKNLLCFLTLLISTNFNTKGMEVDKFFDGTKSNDVIVITRSTPTNDLDYSPLPAAARFLVYEVVKSFLLSSTVNEALIHEAEEKEKSELAVFFKPSIEKQTQLEAQKSQPGAKKSEINKQIAALQHEDPAFFKLHGYYSKFSLHGSVEHNVQQIQTHLSPFKVENETLVVFNEMFFGKNSPFPIGHLERELTQLSAELPPIVGLHVNLLTYIKFSSQQPSQPKHAPVQQTFFESASSVLTIDSYTAKLTKPVTSELANRSIILSSEKVIQTYFKSSYYSEADDFLKLPGVAYVFGRGVDEPPLPLSSMICFDVTSGARSTSSRALVIPSNTLELNDGNMSRIPANVEVLIHADPRDFRVFLNRSKYLRLTTIPPELDSGLFSSRFPETAEFIRGLEFMIDIGGINNIFRVNHWRILPK